MSATPQQRKKPGDGETSDTCSDSKQMQKHTASHYDARRRSADFKAPLWVSIIIWTLQILVLIAVVVLIHTLYVVVYQGRDDYDPLTAGLETVRGLRNRLASSPSMSSSLRRYTREELAKHDGSDEKLPVLLSFRGHVYDVSSKRHIYGRGGDYGFFAGRDATRAFATGCFTTECLRSDTDGLTDAQQRELERWEQFYQKNYPLVGLCCGD